MSAPVHGLYRSAAFRLTLVYLAVFTAFAGALIAYMAWSTRVILANETRETIAAETRGLAEQYAAGGIQQLVEAVANRSRGPANALYLVSAFSGEVLAGNIAALPLETVKQEGFVRVPYNPKGEPDGIAREAEVRVFRLAGGFVLVVGRDISDRIAVERVLWRAGGIAVALTLLLGLAAGVFIRARILRPMDAMADTASAIMAGDLSNRVPVSGTSDEFDRLGASLNAMLARIEALVRGMREVTDNVAHDLKTPLTRLKARAEDALRGLESGSSHDPAVQRQVLVDTIAEADQLIGVFSALLAIARAEAGEGAGHDRVDLAALATDAVDLYEPLAEEAGMSLTCDAPRAAVVIASKALLARAVSNLIENAITHGRRDGAGKVTVSVAAGKGHAELVIADNGPGIPAEERERVLQRFVRLEASRSRPGSGLGLSLANAVVRLHNGTLELEDNEPGLRVVVRMPLAQDDPHGQSAKPESGRTG
ncbi:MAG: HAMP domain-containing histidine kinase [Rhodobiaceae bacterium]|nr:HAMP domain-containing histidine kinase [Rhodobiaceae bacterium]